MSNTKSTKRALLSSVMAMLICVAMLIGTTFAWFTDSVTSSGNKIQSGTLNIDLLVKKDVSTASDSVDMQYVSVKNDHTAIFDYDKWEPGYTEVRNVKVSTTGNLALKYTLKIVPQSATADAFKLAEVIDVYYANSEVTVTDRNDLTGLTRIGSLKDFFTAGTVINDTLIPDQGNTEDYATIVLKMQESANNDYQGLSVGNGFDLHVLAAQYTYEEDSFDGQYDADAVYPIVDSASLNNALINGGSIVLGADAKAESYLDISNDTTISLDGNTLTIGDNTELLNGSDLTVSGGTVLRETFSGYVDVRPGTTTDSVIKYTDVVFDNTYKTMTYGPCTDRVKSALEFCPENGGSATFYFKNCTFNNSQVLFEGLSDTTGSFTATFENCTFNNLGTSAGIKVDNYLTGTVTVKDCTFNLTATATMTAIESSNSVVTWNFEGANTVNGYAATASGENGTVDQIKVMTPSVKVYSINTTNGTVVNGLDTVTVTGIAAK